MEEFKSLDELAVMDEKHRLMGFISGSVPDLAKMHKYLSAEVLNSDVPDEIKGQFNVAKNMALYSYYFYALAPEVQLKTYTLIEHSLRHKANTNARTGLSDLLKLALRQKWISDAGFRHIDNPTPYNKWCREMIRVIPKQRNSKAHGSNLLVGDCLHHISSCADFINQLFPAASSSDV